MQSLGSLNLNSSVASTGATSGRSPAYLFRVPPAPELIAQLYARYQELLKDRLLPPQFTFQQFFAFWSSSRRSEDFVGLDDGATEQKSSRDLQLIERPRVKLHGVVRTLVLLVDFEDQPIAPCALSPIRLPRSPASCSGAAQRLGGSPALV